MIFVVACQQQKRHEESKKCSARLVFDSIFGEHREGEDAEKYEVKIIGVHAPEFPRPDEGKEKPQQSENAKCGQHAEILVMGAPPILRLQL